MEATLSKAPPIVEEKEPNEARLGDLAEEEEDEESPPPPPPPPPPAAPGCEEEEEEAAPSREVVGVEPDGVAGRMSLRNDQVGIVKSRRGDLKGGEAMYLTASTMQCKRSLLPLDCQQSLYDVPTCSHHAEWSAEWLWLSLHGWLGHISVRRFS